MAKDHKRKRSLEEEDFTEQPPTKSRLVENEGKLQKKSNFEKHDGHRRQAKSERTKKRDIEARQNGRHKKGETSRMKPATRIIAQNEITAGQDFIPLVDTSSQIKQTEVIPKVKKKRRSPRSIRKEARDKKLAENPTPVADTRFICFVGNLPFSVTTEQISAHFSKLQPTGIRLSTDKKTGKCKGFAFLEFDNYDKMETCLKLYHHSIFNPEKNTPGENDEQQEIRLKGRKINVELTAGGGGKSANRKDKIKSKNKKLHEERERLRKKKKLEEKKKGEKDRDGKIARTASGSVAKSAEHLENDTRGDIHPSRLGRVKG